jgi:excisionase family DNA binding protein
MKNFILILLICFGVFYTHSTFFGSVNLSIKTGSTMDGFFTVSELAKYFRVNPKTIYRRLWAKGIPAFKVGRAWRIAKKDIMWLKR